MGKWWSVLFAVVMTACAGLFVVAPFVHGWWLPQVLSSHGHLIDRLFFEILGVTAFFFILTEALMCWFMFKYAHTDKAKPAAEVAAPVATPKEPGALAKMCAPVIKMFSSEHNIEIAWTIVPAVILLYIAFAQVDVWASVKYRSRMPQAEGEKAGAKDMPTVGPDDKMPLQAGISARQWEWRVRYPNVKTWHSMKKDPKIAETWAKRPQYDDIHLPNDLHVIMDRPVVIHLTTIDVLHSLWLPQMHVKQDSLPGKIIPVWFTPIDANTIKVKDKNGEWVWQDGGGWYEDGSYKDAKLVWEIACAELCGSRHGYMKGRVYVHPDEADYLDWLATTERRQHAHGEVKPEVK